MIKIRKNKKEIDFESTRSSKIFIGGINILKSVEDLDKIFNEQLEKVGVNYFDYYLLHNLGVSHYEIEKKVYVIIIKLKLGTDKYMIMEVRKCINLLL